jgi:HSP20 family protein
MPARGENRGRTPDRGGAGIRPTGTPGRQAGESTRQAEPPRAPTGGGAARKASGSERGAPRSGQVASPPGAEASRGGGASIGEVSVAGGPRDTERPRDLGRGREGRAGTSADVNTTLGRTGAAPAVGISAAAGSSNAARRPGGQALSPWVAGAEHPLMMMRRMQDDLDRVFQVFGIPRLGLSFAPVRELEDVLARSPGLSQAAQWSPNIEVFERDGSLVVRADVPGVKREDMEVNVENNVLTIRGQRRDEYTDVQGGYRRTERGYGSFFRQIALPDGVEPGDVEASYQDGVLEVTIPAPREQQRGRRRVDIR